MRLFPLSVLLLSASTASASEITYRAAPGCPSRDAVAAQLAERAPNARNVDVKVRPSARGFAGQATLGVGEDAVERRVEGRTCEAVVDALILAVALDKTEPPSAPPHASTPDSAREPAPAKEAPPAELAPLAPASKAASRFEVGAGIDMALRELRWSTVVGLTLFGEGRIDGAFGLGWYRPSLRAGFTALTSFTERGEVAVQSPTSFVFVEMPAMTFVGGSIDACPLAVAPVSTHRIDLVLGVCGALNIGSAGDLAQTLWIEGGGIGRAMLEIGRKGGTRAFFDLSGGILKRLNELPVAPPPTNAPLSFRFPTDATMLTLSAGGGVIFP